MRNRGLANMGFLCRCGHFMQFLAKCFMWIDLSATPHGVGLSKHALFLAKFLVIWPLQPHLHPHQEAGIGKHEFSVQIWTFYTTHSKTFFSKMISHLTHERCGAWLFKGGSWSFSRPCRITTQGAHSVQDLWNTSASGALEAPKWGAL